MASEITYAEVRFKNESKTSGANLEPPEAPEKKTSPQKSSPGLPKQLFASLLILLLLLAVSCFISFINILLPNTEKVWGCCPENWIAVTTSCYFIILDANSWNDSEKKCTEMGTHLMVVNTQEEQKLIVKKLQLKKDSAYYVGLSDPEGKHQWQWIDQSPYDKDAM
ncbi:C-type lectin domain family 4 member A-like [Rhynchocyon petersi]